ncbi:hypothetical protein Q7P37_009678 [Cladosporium fusiforme]
MMKASAVCIGVTSLAFPHHVLTAASSEPRSYRENTGSYGTVPRPYDSIWGEAQTDNTTNQTYFIEAYRNPDVTKSVPFTLAGHEGWTWRINVTNVGLPTAPDGLDSYLVGTTHDLQWPNKSSTLREAVDSMDVDWIPETFGDRRKVCAFSLHQYTFPEITNRYNDSSSNSCDGVIPDECLSFVLNAARSVGTGHCRMHFNGTQLRDACEDTWDVDWDFTLHDRKSLEGSDLTHNYTYVPKNADKLREDFNQTEWVLYNGLWEVDNRIVEDRPLNNSDAFWSEHSRSFNESNTTAIEQRKSKLNVLVLSMANNFQQALCTRIDPEIDDKEITPHRFKSDGLPSPRSAVEMAGLSLLLMVFIGLG